jgi:SAM-dependent methyltransferase
MTSDRRKAIVARFWRLMEAREWLAARALLAPDFVAEWPQTNERFPSPDAFMSMNEAHPAPNWHITSVSVQSTESEVVAEALVTSDESADIAVGFYELRGDLITRAREYWIERGTEPPPAWRAAWTEPIETPKDDPKRIVREGYDAVSSAYADDEGRGRAEEQRRWLAPLIAGLPQGATVLDLGCGAGVPATKILAETFRVVGVDISPVQIERARHLVPTAKFMVSDMTAADFEPESFDAVVSLYAVIHVPLAEQPPLFASVHRWLRPGGYLLATVGMEAHTGTEDDWLVPGVRMYWSHADEATYARWLEDLGFTLQKRTFVPEGDGGHVLLLATKAA